MKRYVCAAVFCLLCGLLSAAAYATPSTLIWIPSTDMQAPRTIHQGNDVYAGSDVKPLYDHGLTFGAEKLEFGVDYLAMPTTNATWLNAKYLVTDEKESMPRIVVGAYNWGKKEDGAPNFLYLLGSKTTKAARFTAGICTGRKSTLLVDETHILLGVDKCFNSKWWGAVDYQSGKNAFGALNVGVAYSFTPKASMIVGHDFYNDKALPDTWTLQLDINY